MSKRKFCVLQILIVTMLVVALLVNTYAWSDRGSDTGSMLSLLDYQFVVNGTVDEQQTFWIVDGAEQKIEDGAEFGVSDGVVLYFKTVVSNASENAVDSNFSLFLQNACLVANVDAQFIVRVSSPTREHREYADSDTHDWVRILPSCEVGAGSTVIIEWSIKFVSEYDLDDFSSGRFTFDAVVLEHF